MATNARETGWFTRAVASQIRAQLGIRKWKQAELSRLTGIHKATMSSLLSGDKPIDLEQMRKIANALELDPKEIWDAAETQGASELAVTEALTDSGGVRETDEHIEEILARKRRSED